MTYLTPTTVVQCEIHVKKSRFIARAAKVQSKHEALHFISCAKKDYPDARHHCWAYVLGNPLSPSAVSMNDDGEPSGTAGKPILNVIQHKKIGDLIVVVIRYFGGIKLGSGGLVRAYSGSTEKVISLSPTKKTIITQEILITLAFGQEQLCRHWAKQHQTSIQEVTYSSEVKMILSVPNQNLISFHDFCLSNTIQIGIHPI